MMKLGMEGVGVYWCIVEMLYECNGKLMLSECERIAFELRVTVDCIKSLIYSDLFERNESEFWSESALRRLENINGKSDKAKESALKRWGKESERNANALQSECAPNAIKGNKRKGKEKKEKEKKEGIPVADAPAVKVAIPSTKKETTQHWQALVDTWHQFYEQHKFEKPIFSGREPAALKSLAADLKKKVLERHNDWSEKTAVASLKMVLDYCINDPFFSSKFELHIIAPKLQSIIEGIKKNKDGKPTIAKTSQPDRSALAAELAAEFGIAEIVTYHVNG